MTTEAPAFDEAKVEAFMGKVVGDAAGLTTSLLVAFGDKLGLFKELAANGPATSGELAERTSTNERYAREWLAAMVASGYLAHDPQTSGGLLAAIPREAVKGVHKDLVDAGIDHWAVGRVEASDPPGVRLT